MRSKPAVKRKIKPDYRHSNLEVAKLVNYIMERGKKTVAQAVVYGAFEIIYMHVDHVAHKAVKHVCQLREAGL